MFFNKQVFDSARINGDTLPCDRWIASSLLQKSVRRGDAELAQRAAFHLLELDKAAIWRRLIVIAFEDVGAGDLDVLLETVFVASSSEWRRVCGKAVAALGLITRHLAEAIKDRSGDYLICAAKDHFDLSETCDLCRKTSLEQRLALLADSSQPLAKRAVAAWFASGINWRYDHQVRGGDIRALAGAYRELGADKELANAMVLAAKRAPEPLVALVPLIWLEVQRSGPIRIRSDPVPQTKTIAGVPLYAFDKHTRLGKRAIERLLSENKPLRDCIVGFLAQGSPKKSAEIAAFYADAAPVARRLDWAQSDSLERLGIEADFIAAGLRLEGIEPVQAAMNAALEQLNEIRAELWTAAVAAGV
jgi:hypothetical protein